MQTLQDAIDNEAKQKAAHDAKLAVLAEAIAKKESTIASAAGGAVVRADDLLKLETAARTAEAGVAISGSILAGATRLRHQAEIDLWHEEAATLTGAEDQAIAARIAAGYAVDLAANALRTAIEKFNAAGNDLTATRQAVAVFDSAAASRASGNPVLAARTQGEHPQAGRGHAGRPQVRKLAVHLVEKNALETMIAGSVRDIGQREALLHGRPAETIVVTPGVVAAE